MTRVNKRWNLKVVVVNLAVLFALTGCLAIKGNQKSAQPTITVAKNKEAPTPNAQVLGNAIDTKAPKPVLDSGLFNVSKVGERYLFEVSDSLFSRELLVVSRISKGAAGTRGGMIGYSGDQINENIIRFERLGENKVVIRSLSFQEFGGDSTSAIFRSLSNSNLQPIVASFEVKGRSKDGRSLTIDMTDFISGDNDILFFSSGAKSALRVIGYMGDRSYINGIRSYKNNVEIETVKTYGRAAALVPGQSAGGTSTFELNTSIVLLPRTLMRTRDSDLRIGYFTTRYNDFNAQGIDKASFINRWRLEPRAGDVARYLAGELVEPVKPIVFYIDPNTPKKWVPYLIQGVNDWNRAFEKAGFKNAIVAREAPVSDPEWSLEDAAHNAIVYKPSDISNAAGPTVVDPRTGEILETHVSWYHNIMRLLHNWYLIQAGAVDTSARKMVYSDELMGSLIRFVSSHEIGHTLGLAHNYGSSSTVPVDSLRNKAWVEKNGHTPSIMDYARFNYVAQPEDKIGALGIFPRINDYDLWAVEWGYRWFPEQSKETEKANLNKWVISRTAGNKRLWYGNDAEPTDPNSQSEDLGDNAMKASYYGIKNLKRILPNIVSWSSAPNGSYDGAVELYSELLGQYGRYMGHVVKNIAGVTFKPKYVGQPGPIFEYVPKERQQEAIAFLHKQLFETPAWLLDRQMFTKTFSGSITTISRQQEAVLSKLLNANILYRLMQFEGQDPLHAYTPAQMLGELQDGIFSELKSAKEITIYRRNLQKSYVEKLIALMVPPPPMPPGAAQGPDVRFTDIYSVAKMELGDIRAQIGVYLKKAVDKSSRMHVMDLRDRIDGELNKNTK